MGDDDHPEILLSNRQSMPVDETGLTQLAAATLAAEGHGRVELSLSLVGEDEMADLHLRYMSEEGPTDVLTFPLDDARDDRGVRVLGDVVVAPSVASRNNPSNPDAEMRLLVVHGVLHILGYDHEDAAERLEMWSRQALYSGVSVP